MPLILFLKLHEVFQKIRGDLKRYLQVRIFFKYTLLSCKIFKLKMPEYTEDKT